MNFHAQPSLEVDRLYPAVYALFWPAKTCEISICYVLSGRQLKAAASTKGECRWI